MGRKRRPCGFPHRPLVGSAGRLYDAVLASIRGIEMPDAPTRFDRVANWFDGLRKVLVALGVSVIVIIVVAAVVRELAAGGIAIDPVVVKASATPDVPTPELAAQQIARHLDRIQRAGVKEWRRVNVDDGTQTVDLQIPGAPLSLRSAARELVALFGAAPVTLRSALTRRNDQGAYSAVMSLAGDHGSTANCPAETVGGITEDTLDNIYECIALNAIADIDPKTAAAYTFQLERAQCKGLDAGVAPGAPDLQRVEQRINNRRERCSFSHTQNLIAKVMAGGNKADLRWVPYIYGEVHLARADALSDLQQQLSELDQAIGRFRDSQALTHNAPTAIAVLMNAILTKGIKIHQTTPALGWDDDPQSLLQTRLKMAEDTLAEAGKQLQELPTSRTASVDALVNRLEGLRIYRQWLIVAHRRTKSGDITVALGVPDELALLNGADKKYAAAQAKIPASADDLMNWGNVSRARGEWKDAIAKYRAAADLDPSKSGPALNIAVTYLDWFERTTPADKVQLMVALGALSDYLAWISDGGPYVGLQTRVRKVLSGVGHGAAFDECLNRTLAQPGSTDPKIDHWKAAAAFKFCVDEAINRIAKEGLRTTDASR
jgi:tetratricopeptide (TPR) repeat protein